MWGALGAAARWVKGTILITVKMIDDQTFSLEAKPTDTVMALKQRIASMTGIADLRGPLKFEGRQLKVTSQETLADLGMKDGSTITWSRYSFGLRNDSTGASGSAFSWVLRSLRIFPGTAAPTLETRW